MTLRLYTPFLFTLCWPQLGILASEETEKLLYPKQPQAQVNPNTMEKRENTLGDNQGTAATRVYASGTSLVQRDWSVALKKTGASMTDYFQGWN